MLVRSILFITLFVFATPYAAAYDAVKIKQLINDEKELFKITKWHGDDEKQQWRADSVIKYLSVEINRKQTKIGSPYFSPTLRKAAQARCTAVASLALGAATEEEKAAITNVMDKATQHHQRKSFELNNVRFEAMPVVKGPFVTLFCSVTLTGTS